MPTLPSSLREVLKKTPLFSALTESELEALATRTSIRTCTSSEMLFFEGDACSGLYIVAKGHVRIFKTSANGREQVLAIESQGGSVAELPIFDGGPYPASAATVEASELLFISRKDFHSLCQEHPDVALKVLRVVGARLRRLVNIIEELSFTTVRQRLISWILRQAQTEGATLILSGGHQELAAHIGTVRELVSRNLARLQAQGFIALNGRELTVIDKSGLEVELSNVV